jgi:small subunit ribosomal protein S8
MQDPVADMLTRIRNGQMAAKPSVSMPSSTVKTAIAQVLADEGYLEIFAVDAKDGGKNELNIVLKYYNGKPVIETITRASRPGLRSYKGKDALPKVRAGLGVAIISTSQGMMTDKTAREKGIGGEILCTVF